MNIGKFCPLPPVYFNREFPFFFVYCFLVVILPNWVCDNWVYRFPIFGLTEFRGESSVSSFQPIICVLKQNLTEFSQNSTSLPQNSVSSLYRNSALEIAFRQFTKHFNFGHSHPPRKISELCVKTLFSLVFFCFCRASGQAFNRGRVREKRSGRAVRRSQHLT